MKCSKTLRVSFYEPDLIKALRWNNLFQEGEREHSVVFNIGVHQFQGHNKTVLGPIGP